MVSRKEKFTRDVGVVMSSDSNVFGRTVQTGARNGDHGPPGQTRRVTDPVLEGELAMQVARGLKSMLLRPMLVSSTMVDDLQPLFDGRCYPEPSESPQLAPQVSWSISGSLLINCGSPDDLLVVDPHGWMNYLRMDAKQRATFARRVIRAAIKNIQYEWTKRPSDGVDAAVDDVATLNGCKALADRYLPEQDAAAMHSWIDHRYAECRSVPLEEDGVG